MVSEAHNVALMEERMVASMKALMTKYVLSGAEFEINIPFALRNELSVIYEGVGTWMELSTREEQLQVFDDCIRDIRRLIRDSYSRFRKTSEFEQCKKILMLS